MTVSPDSNEVPVKATSVKGFASMLVLAVLVALAAGGLGGFAVVHFAALRPSPSRAPSSPSIGVRSDTEAEKLLMALRNLEDERIRLRRAIAHCDNTRREAQQRIERDNWDFDKQRDDYRKGNTIFLPLSPLGSAHELISQMESMKTQRENELVEVEHKIRELKRKLTIP